MKVSGLTMTRASRQSNSFASAIIATRVIAVARRCFVLRSLNSASCLRKNKFSAIRAARDDKNKRRRASNPQLYQREFFSNALALVDTYR